MKDELISKITLALADIINSDLGELKSRLYIAMHGYNIKLENTELVVREENKDEWFFKKFIMTKTVQGLSEKTIKLYAAEIPKILRKIGKPVEKLESDDILYYLAVRECQDKVSKVTCLNELRYLRSFLEFLSVEGYIPSNPVRKIGTIKIEKKKKKAFSDMELVKIRKACKNLKEKAIIEILLSTGCRVAELVSIKIKDLEDRKIVVKGKGKRNKERTVYLNAQALYAVEEYMESMAKTKNPYLFPKMKTVTYSARRCRRTAGPCSRSCHDLA